MRGEDATRKIEIKSERTSQGAPCAIQRTLTTWERLGSSICLIRQGRERTTATQPPESRVHLPRCGDAPLIVTRVQSQPLGKTEKDDER